MGREFLLPDLGEGLTEAEIVAWLVQPGDVIAVDQPVVEVESAKSTVELPSPYGGRVEKLHAEPGQTVHAGGVLITVAESGRSGAGRGARRRGSAAPRCGPEPRMPRSGAVLVGYGTKEPTLRLARPAAGRFGGRARSVADRRSPVVSPLVRRRALDNGIDASQLRGSGPGSLVMRQDVEAAIAAKAREPRRRPATPASRSPACARSSPTRLSHSRATIPEATIWLDVDATELFAAKERLQKSTGERFSLTALIARFAVVGLGQVPDPELLGG